MADRPVCVFRGAGQGRCEGRLQWHHVLSQNRLKREFKYGAYRAGGEGRWWPLDRYMQSPSTLGDIRLLSLDDILGDTRNRVFLCDTHHERLHNHRFYLELPEEVWEFARAFGMDAALENDMRRAA